MLGDGPFWSSHIQKTVRTTTTLFEYWTEIFLRSSVVVGYKITHLDTFHQLPFHIQFYIHIHRTPLFKKLNIRFSYNFYFYITFCFVSDMNECLKGLDNCDKNADCINTVGSHLCNCNAWGATLGTAWYSCRKSRASSRNSFTKNDAFTLNKFITRKVIKSQP
jgi:hypothetical protein